jgi:hypothetical protein
VRAAFTSDAIAKQFRGNRRSPVECCQQARTSSRAKEADAADDVLIRLDPALRQDASGRADPAIYEINLAIVEALIKRADVPIDGEIGATTDGMFAFARKLGAGAPARGWFHWSQHGLRGLPEPRRKDGRFEYTRRPASRRPWPAPTTSGCDQAARVSRPARRS